MENEPGTPYTYEGRRLVVREIHDIVFRFACDASMDGKPTLTGLGFTEDGAVEHAKILINREVSHLGS